MDNGTTPRGINRRRFLKRMSAAVIGTGVGLSGLSNGSGSVIFEDIAIEMSDGVSLRGNVHFPSQDGETIADGSFPVILTVTPYTPVLSGRNTPREFQDENPFVQEGYIRAVVDVRGTGESEGEWRFFGSREQQDYGELIHWASELPQSTGGVGMTGDSYMGINQFYAARAAGPDSPLEAINPGIAGVELYRNAFFPGGLWNKALYSLLPGIFTSLHASGPFFTTPYNDLGDTVEMVQARVAGDYSQLYAPTIGAQLGSDEAYREDWWRIRSWQDTFAKIAGYETPVMAHLGWYDVYARGSPYIYTQLQNVWADRPQYAPMRPHQPVNSRFQIVIGPYTHTTPSERSTLALDWFDRFLKGEQNGIDDTKTPLHIFQLHGGRWIDTDTWPLPDTTVRTYHFHAGRTETAPSSTNDGWLRPTQPVGTTASDVLNWRPNSNPCTQSTDQHTLGLALSQCRDQHDSRTYGPAALMYTTPPFEEGAHLAGPITTSIFASSTTENTTWVVKLDNVGPDGSSRLLSNGALKGSLRAIDRERSWYVRTNNKEDPPLTSTPDAPLVLNGADPPPESKEKKLLRPYHIFSREREQPVVPGEIVRYDIEMTGVFAWVAPGHRLRLTIQTTAPWAQPVAADVPDLVGGSYQIQHNQRYASHVNLPFVDSPFKLSDRNWGSCSHDCGTPPNG